ncbi:MAG: hypothetical protein KBD19_00760 [Candidatus Moranbacteria bacterium]|nr:hypothetical protein [Candidatus Moranbacteria bacterium]
MEKDVITLNYDPRSPIDPFSVKEPYSLHPDWKARAIRGGCLKKDVLERIFAKRGARFVGRHSNNRVDIVEINPVSVDIRILETDGDDYTIVLFQLVEHAHLIEGAPATDTDS